MKERPILFSDTMVRALLVGRKTQTRRIVKPQPEPVPADYPGPTGHWWPSNAHRTMLHVEAEMQKWAGLAGHCCPFGQPGDRLWVRECFTLESCRHLDYYDPPHKDGRPIERIDDGDEKWWTQPHYRATDPEPELWYDDMPDPGCRWRPPIHMSRKWSRITLEITGVRVERLQDISEADAKAEGADSATPVEDGYVADELGTHATGFEALWQYIYGAESWQSNPWVWCVEFKKVTL